LTHDLEERVHVTTLDLAKRLLDFGIHPPTIYFPLVVHGALMIEPTETESRETLDRFVEVMRQIYEEGLHEPETLRMAPHRLRLGRVDEVTAARRPVLRWKKPVE
jgi:glycine dehydrogenase subunit 2